MKLPTPQTIDVSTSYKAFDGLRILHLSDLHINKKTTQNDIEALVKLCHTLEYDFAVITGDIIDCSVKHIVPQLKRLNQIKKCYYISGNHDLVYGLNDLKKALHELIYLDNTTALISHNNELILLAGLSDRFSKFFKLQRQEDAIKKELSDHAYTILLAHQPKDYKLAVETNSALFLCGHTHGGQIYPFHYVVKLFQPFLNGLFYKKKTAIYVNSGLGTWGIDMRFKSKSEITLLKLTSKSVQYSKGMV